MAGRITGGTRRLPRLLLDLPAASASSGSMRASVVQALMRILLQRAAQQVVDLAPSAAAKTS